MFSHHWKAVLLVVAMVGLVVAEPVETTTWHGRLEVVYTGDVPTPGKEIGGFIDVGYFQSDLNAGLGNYGLYNDAWPDYWIYGFDMFLGYRSTSDATASNVALCDLFDAGVDAGDAQWAVSFFYDNTAGSVWTGDGPHPDLAGNVGDFPNIEPSTTDRQGDGNPYDSATDVPYATVAWGEIAASNSTLTKYDANGVAQGQSGYDSGTGGFAAGGYTVRLVEALLTDAYGGGVWDFGPGGTRYDTTTDWGEGWGPDYEFVKTFYHDPNNISGLFGGNDVYGQPYLWTATNGEGDLSTFWYEPIPEPSTCLLLLLGAFGLLLRRRRR